MNFENLSFWQIAFLLFLAYYALGLLICLAVFLLSALSEEGQKDMEELSTKLEEFHSIERMILMAVAPLFIPACFVYEIFFGPIGDENESL